MGRADVELLPMGPDPDQPAHPETIARQESREGPQQVSSRRQDTSPRDHQEPSRRRPRQHAEPLATPAAGKEGPAVGGAGRSRWRRAGGSAYTFVPAEGG